MTGAVVALFVLLAGVGPLILYALVRSEHDARARMDRERAEDAARRDVDTGTGPSNRDRDGRRRDA